MSNDKRKSVLSTDYNVFGVLVLFILIMPFDLLASLDTAYGFDPYRSLRLILKTALYGLTLLGAFQTRRLIQANKDDQPLNNTARRLQSIVILVTLPCLAIYLLYTCYWITIGLRSLSQMG